MTCDNVPGILEVLDTAGQEEYKCIAQQWVKKKQGFVLVYSIIDEVSFQNLKAFYDLLEEEYLNNEEEPERQIPPVILLGNKLDLEVRPSSVHYEAVLMIPPCSGTAR